MLISQTFLKHFIVILTCQLELVLIKRAFKFTEVSVNFIWTITVLLVFVSPPVLE